MAASQGCNAHAGRGPWKQQRNQAQVTIDGRFTTADARIKFKQRYPVLKEQKAA
jgi:hypothetical protein